MREIPPQDEILTYPEAARLLRVGQRTLHRLVADGKVPHTRLSTGTVRFSRQALLDLIASGGVHSGAV